MQNILIFICLLASPLYAMQKPDPSIPTARSADLFQLLPNDIKVLVMAQVFHIVQKEVACTINEETKHVYSYEESRRCAYKALIPLFLINKKFSTLHNRSLDYITLNNIICPVNLVLNFKTKAACSWFSLYLTKSVFNQRYAQMRLHELVSRDDTNEAKVRKLVILGIDITAADDNGITALMRAIDAMRLNSSYIRALLTIGTKITINARDNEGKTALVRAVINHTSAQNRIPDAIRFLLEQGADPRLKDNQQKRAKDYAVSRNLPDLAVYLDDWEYDMNVLEQNRNSFYKNYIQVWAEKERSSLIHGGRSTAGRLFKVA